MRLLDVFRRPDRAPTKERKQVENETRPLPEKIDPPATTQAGIAQDSLPNRASEEDAA